MLKIIFTAIFLAAFTFSNFAEAADKIKVAVMDLGEFGGAYTSELATKNVGAMVSAYIIKNLSSDARFSVIDKEFFEQQVKNKNLQAVGIISPKQAGEIAKILGVDYLIYGNVNNVTGDSGIFEVVRYGGGKSYEVKAKLIIRMMDIKNSGRQIVAAAEGIGVSKSSEIKISQDTIFFKIGATKIPQDSVHNAARKAAADAVTKLIESFFKRSKGG